MPAHIFVGIQPNGAGIACIGDGNPMPDPTRDVPEASHAMRRCWGMNFTRARKQRIDIRCA